MTEMSNPEPFPSESRSMVEARRKSPARMDSGGRGERHGPVAKTGTLPVIRGARVFRMRGSERALNLRQSGWYRRGFRLLSQNSLG